DKQTFSISNGNLILNKQIVSYKFSQLETCYIIQSGDTKKTKHIVTRALIGDMLAGSIGAFAGILSAGNDYTICNELTLHLDIRDGEDYDFKTIITPTKTSSFNYKQGLKNLQDMTEVFQQIMATEIK
ncbi:hypothetical protein, partial [Lactiplantibacillus plajomi]